MTDRLCLDRNPNAMLGSPGGTVYALETMKGFVRMGMMALLLWATACCPLLADHATADKLLAAMPILQPTMTQVRCTVSKDVDLSVNRAITPRVVIGGSASGAGIFDLRVRLLAPLQMAPAFLAIELSPHRVAGLMTLFFGPVSIDLGRSWFESSRWALVQLAVHPRLCMVFGGIQQLDVVVPQAGWRLFPAASAQWEIDVMFTGREIRLSVGGIL